MLARVPNEKREDRRKETSQERNPRDAIHTPKFDRPRNASRRDRAQTNSPFFFSSSSGGRRRRSIPCVPHGLDPFVPTPSHARSSAWISTCSHRHARVSFTVLSFLRSSHPSCFGFGAFRGTLLRFGEFRDENLLPLWFEGKVRKGKERRDDRVRIRSTEGRARRLARIVHWFYDGRFRLVHVTVGKNTWNRSTTNVRRKRTTRTTTCDEDTTGRFPGSLTS